MAALAASQVAKREASRTENRKNFTAAAEAMDLFAEFNPRVIYAEENGKTIGRKPDETNNMDAYRLLDMHDAFERLTQRMNPRKKK